MSAPARLRDPLPPMPIGGSWSQSFALFGEDENDPRVPEGLQLHLYRRDRRALAADEIIVLTSEDGGGIVLVEHVGTAGWSPAVSAEKVAGQYEFQLFEVEGSNLWCRLVGTIAFEAGPVVAAVGDTPGVPLTGATGAVVNLYGTTTISVVLGAGGVPGPAGPQGPVDMMFFANGAYLADRIVFTADLLTAFTMDPDRYSISFAGAATAEKTFQFMAGGVEVDDTLTGGTLLAVATVAIGGDTAVLDYVTTAWPAGRTHLVALGAYDPDLKNGCFSLSGTRAA